MSLESAVREEVRQLAGSAIENIIDAVERERARKRAEACVEEFVAREMLRRLPRWRWLARGIWRVKQRRHASRCAAQRAAGDFASCMLCAEMERRNGATT